MSFASKRVDLLISPETAVPVLESAQGYLDMMGNFAAERQSALITGVPIGKWCATKSVTTTASP